MTIVSALPLPPLSLQVGHRNNE
ncbi:hypothetical protein RSOL_256090 [Rhizoctonia solani AG-3 Rhs1AP]|uniref:Uncharacterized protein n=1 Tax=Rhizoctonia solani AG-3 Rhs1AP TaxID=1086054 RepID=A0A0A1UHS5_9AGAM|nr:hypothetical protein RSOL_256090 [Rhizoctonia solani AG-3 Rhs1AP]